MTTQNPGLKQGAILMVIAALAFIGYAVVFLVRNFNGLSVAYALRAFLSERTGWFAPSCDPWA